MSKADYQHSGECRNYGGGGNVRRAFVTIIETGRIPEGKGPFLTLDHLESFVREAIEYHPDRSTHIVVSELTWDDQLWVRCGREMIAFNDAIDASAKTEVQA